MIAWCAAALAAPDRSRPPAVAEPILLQYPEPTVVHLRPGVDVWHVEVPESRKATVQLVWQRGAADLAPDAPLELARAVGALADRAAGRWSAVELDVWRDLNDAELWSSVGQHELEVGFVAPPDALAEAFARAAAIVHDPRFPITELDEWAVDRRLFYTSSGPASPTAVASASLESAWFPAAHPYGKRPRLAALAALRRADLRAAWSEWTAAAPLVVLAVGGPWSDFAPHVDALVEGVGADAPRGGALPVAAPAEGQLVAIDLPDAPQATIRVRLAAPPSTDPDSATMRVANLVLGGTFAARLNRNLREERGLTYGADSGYRRDETWGAITISVAVPASAVGVAIGEIRRELARLATDPPTAAELDAARRAIAADWNRTFESAPRAAGLYRQVLYEGRTVAAARAEVEQVLAVGADDVARVAARWLDPARAPAWVVVGPRTSIEAGLGSTGIVARWVAPGAGILGRF